jgi:hypothetical protein
MTKLEVLSAALIAAAVLATPAMARASHVTSRHRAVEANASTTPDYGGYGNRHSGLRGGSPGYGGRDVWGHWGTYYGPMIPMI